MMQPAVNGSSMRTDARLCIEARRYGQKTVHTSKIYSRLHILDRTQAVIYAIREGVIDVKEVEYPQGNQVRPRGLRHGPWRRYEREAPTTICRGSEEVYAA